MKMHPPHAPLVSGLTRRSVGLTQAHRELIRLLAQAAVNNYLHEVEVAETAQQPDPGETVAAQQGEAQR
ncbi:MAG: hypothetical protein E6K65_02025 [Nitrospirae bacterium]|nr:MAG: hypothetical protein E6K65_02025 [Nitrospirota bacterium]